MPLTNKEIMDFAEPYINNYGWELMSRGGNDLNNLDTYLYHFIDDAGICITINPNNKGFSFSKNVDFLFRLSSNEFTPFDYKNHFIKNYIRFRKIVIEKNLK